MKLFGDVVADMAKALGFKECDACRRRRRKLNDAHTRLRAKRGRSHCSECDKVQGRA
jgi:hypothetical protein